MNPETVLLICAVLMGVIFGGERGCMFEDMKSLPDVLPTGEKKMSSFHAININVLISIIFFVTFCGC